MRRASVDENDLASLRRLRNLIRGRRRIDAAAAELLPLYRHAATCLARLEARGENARLAGDLRRLVGEAHGLLFRPARTGGPVALYLAALRLFGIDSPRAIRREWRLLALSFFLFYGLAALAYVAVARDLGLAPSLLDPAVVEAEIEQLVSTPDGEAFVGNFTFGIGESPLTAGWIMVHNMGVGVLFFAAALVPPIYLLLLAQNGLMLGTYTGVASHWDQAGAISSILWCHGVLELQALVLAGSAGLALVRALVRPGPWSRRHALRRESRTAWRMLAPVFPLLFTAGLIEGFVSPHAPLGVRLATAIGTGVALGAWLLFAGRGPAGEAERSSSARGAALVEPGG